MSWQALVDGNPELAGYGAGRLTGRVAYLSTVDTNGNPRVHPVSPQLKDNRLFLYMYPTSPKAKDLIRGSYYALHCAVEDDSGGDGEFWVKGVAQQNTNLDDWLLIHPDRAEQFGSKYILFELTVHQAFSMQYTSDGNIINRWKHG